MIGKEVIKRVNFTDATYCTCVVKAIYSFQIYTRIIQTSYLLAYYSHLTSATSITGCSLTYLPILSLNTLKCADLLCASTAC